MNKIALAKVRAVARSVRRDMEVYAEENKIHSNLNGLCAIASGFIHVKLSKLGLNPTVTYAENMGGHFYVEVDNYIIDVTATQFSDAMVSHSKVIVRMRQSNEPWYWQIYGSYDNVWALQQSQIKHMWSTWAIARLEGEALEDIENKYNKFYSFKNQFNIKLNVMVDYFINL